MVHRYIATFVYTAHVPIEAEDEYEAEDMAAAILIAIARATRIRNILMNARVYARRIVYKVTNTLHTLRE